MRKMQKEDIILPVCAEKRVLDIGCAGQAIPFGSPNWVHGRIAEVAKETVGVDVNKDAVEEIQQAGYDVRYADAQDFNLGEKFEVVTLIELIEHVSNPGLVLDHVNKHLVSGGVMVVTTPNPFNPFVFWTYEIKDKGNPGHVAYHSPRMFCRLAERYGFSKKRIVWLPKYWREPDTLSGKLYLLLMKMFPRRFQASHWLGVFEKAEPREDED